MWTDQNLSGRCFVLVLIPSTNKMPCISVHKPSCTPWHHPANPLIEKGISMTYLCKMIRAWLLSLYLWIQGLVKIRAESMDEVGRWWLSFSPGTAGAAADLWVLLPPTVKGRAATNAVELVCGFSTPKEWCSAFHHIIRYILVMPFLNWQVLMIF